MAIRVARGHSQALFTPVQGSIDNGVNGFHVRDPSIPIEVNSIPFMNYPPGSFVAHRPPILNILPTPRGYVHSRVPTGAVFVKQDTCPHYIRVIIHFPIQAYMSVSIFKLSYVHTQASFLPRFSHLYPPYQVHFPPNNSGTPHEVPMDPINLVAHLGWKFYVLHFMAGNAS